MSDKDDAVKQGTVSNSELIETLGSLIATCRTTTQIGPDDYEVTPVFKIITPDMRVSDLIAWYKTYFPTARVYFEIAEAT